jgi:hypothetical protein
MLLLLPLPMILDAVGSVGAGWPIFSALHAEASTAVKYACALATFAIAGTLLKVTVDFAARKSQEAHAGAEAVSVGRPVRI